MLLVLFKLSFIFIYKIVNWKYKNAVSELKYFGNVMVKKINIGKMFLSMIRITIKNSHNNYHLHQK